MLGQDISGSTLASSDTFGAAGLIRRASAALVCGLALAGFSATAAAVGDLSLVTYANPGIGIGVESGLPGDLIEINHDPQTGLSEALALDLGQEYTVLTFQTEAMEADEGGYREWGRWQAFDGSGVLVGTGTFAGLNPSPVVETSGMRYVVFTALPYTLTSADPSVPPVLGTPDPGKPPVGAGYPTGDSSDYYITSITVDGNMFEGSSAEDYAGLSPSGFAAGTDYLQGGRFVDAAPLVVNTAECAGDSGQNNTSGCELKLTGLFKTVIKNAPDVNGSIEVNDLLTIVDTRDSCGGDGTTLDGPLDLGPALGLVAGGPFVPAHLCGIPDENGVPKFTLMDINSTGFTTEYSVLEHEIDNEAIALNGFECRTGADILSGIDGTLAERRSKLPVVAWLPKAEGEIPVKQGNTVIDTLQDITYGCGSYRGGTNRYSYFAYNLRHTVDADYQAIVRNALVQLSATIDQTSACVDSGNGSFAGIASGMKTVLAAYDSNRLPLAKQHLQKLLAKVESHKQLNERYRGCFYDLDNDAIVKGSPGEFPTEEVPNVVPRNFRADLIVQTRHALYMFGRMLGVIDQNLPDDFKGLPPI
jgi:hypothetical protein